MEKTFETVNEQQTQKLGEVLGKLLYPGDFLALKGDLGAGKTAFTKGIAKGLGISDDITSPTFTIINEYAGKIPLAHMDAYRLASPEELENIGFSDYLSDFVVVLEWADKVQQLLPENVIWIDFKVLNEGVRQIYFKSDCKHYDEIMQELKI